MEFSLFCHHCHAYLGTELSFCPDCGTKRDTFSVPLRPGEILWQAKLAGASRGAPVMAGDLVIFAWGNRRDKSGISAFDRTSGEPAWTYLTETTCEAAPVVMGERLFFDTLSYITGAKIGCLEVVTGKEIWVQSLPDSAWSSPVVQEGRVFAGTSNGQIFGFSNDSGEPLRNYPYEFIRGKLWLVPVNEFQFAALSESGAVQLCTAMQKAGCWRQPAEIQGHISGTAGLYNGCLYFGTATNNVTKAPVLEDGSLVELALNHGTIGVIAKNIKTLSAAPKISNGTLYAAARDHRIHAIDLKTKKEVWTGLAEHSFAVTPEFYAGLVIAASHDGSIYAFAADPEPERYIPGGLTTRPVWKYPVINASRGLSSALCCDEVCYQGVEDGTVLAFPYHLGEYGWMALHQEREAEKLKQEHQTTALINQAHKKAGDAYALASCFAEPIRQGEYCERAVNHWQLAGEPEWGARFYAGRQELTKAARAFETCAEFQRGKNRLLAAADFYDAARCYWRVNDEINYQRCQKEACRLGGWPLIELEWINQSELQQLKAGNVTIRAKNVGSSNSGPVKYKLGGSLMHYQEFEVREPVKHDSWVDLSLEIIPTQKSSDLTIEVEYTVPSIPLPFTNRLTKTISATPPPPKIKMGDVLKGNVKIYNPSNQSVDMEIGNNLMGSVEIIMGEAPVYQDNGEEEPMIECPRCHHSLNQDAMYCTECQLKLK